MPDTTHKKCWVYWGASMVESTVPLWSLSGAATTSLPHVPRDLPLKPCGTNWMASANCIKLQQIATSMGIFWFLSPTTHDSCSQIALPSIQDLEIFLAFRSWRIQATHDALCTVTDGPSQQSGLPVDLWHILASQSQSAHICRCQFHLSLPSGHCGHFIPGDLDQHVWGRRNGLSNLLIRCVNGFASCRCVIPIPLKVSTIRNSASRKGHNHLHGDEHTIAAMQRAFKNQNG